MYANSCYRLANLIFFFSDSKLFKFFFVDNALFLLRLRGKAVLGRLFVPAIYTILYIMNIRRQPTVGLQGQIALSPRHRPGYNGSSTLALKGQKNAPM